MPRKETESATYDLLTQKVASEEVTLTAVIESVKTQKLSSGKTVDVVEYTNDRGELKSAKVWDKRIAAALKAKVGTALDLRFRKNARGFWNLALTHEELETAGESAPVATETTPKTAQTQPSRTSNHPLRESLNLTPIIASDVALAKAADLVIHFSGVLQPRDQTQILDQVARFYQALLNIHDRSGET